MLSTRKGIILAGGSGSRLYPSTAAVSKQLLPVYDKPMIYYPISVLMFAGIREILIISTPRDLPLFEQLLGDGSQFGVQFHYQVQPNPQGLAQAFPLAEEAGFLKGDPCALILGDNLIYGREIPRTVRRVAEGDAEATVFAYHVADPRPYGVIEFDADGKALSIVEKPTHPRTNFAIPGLYFYGSDVVEVSRSLRPSARGEYEITDLNRVYLERGTLQVEQLGRGIAWLDTGSHDSLLEASEFVHVIEKRQGLKIACLEEIAYSYQWINRETLEMQIRAHGNSSYSDYLRSLLR